MADEGLYINRGRGFELQNSGVCLNSGGGEVDIYAHNGGGWVKIYPRIIPASFDEGSWQGLACSTIRSGYGGSNWNPGYAKQGYYYGSKCQKGNIFWRGGKPYYPNLQRVTNVDMDIRRNVNTGNWHNWITGSLHLSTTRDSGSWGSTVVSNEHFDFAWAPNGATSRVSGNGDLNNLMYKFLVEPQWQSLCLYNGESGGGSWSANYGASSQISIRISVEYRP